MTVNARPYNHLKTLGLCLSFVLLFSSCGGESDGPSAADKALEELQSKYDELRRRQPDDAVQWAADDLENIGDWEYRVVELSYKTSEDLETELNNLGDERWEVFWVDRTHDGVVVLLKRPSVSYLGKIPLSQIGRFIIDDSGSQ